MQPRRFQRKSIGKESLRITAFAVVLEVPILLAFGLIVKFGSGSAYELFGWTAFLALLGAVCVFAAAWGFLQNWAIDSARRGALFGLAAALVFYLFLFILFGVIPASTAIAAGRGATALSYLGLILKVIFLTSRGLPLVLGAIGGAAYGAFNSRMQ